MIIVGIDPGVSGAIAFLDKHRATVRSMPTLKVTKNKRTIDEITLRNILEHRAAKIEHIFIEKVSAMPKQGVVSMFNFGVGWGLIRGVIVGLHLPYTLVHPNTWKRTICKDMPRGSKDVSIIVAKRLWPDVDLRRTERSKKNDNGKADALCIAEYGRRELGK